MALVPSEAPGARRRPEAPGGAGPEGPDRRGRTGGAGPEGPDRRGRTGGAGGARLDGERSGARLAAHHPRPAPLAAVLVPPHKAPFGGRRGHE